MDIISMVQSIENDYGMNYKLWPENDVRLKKLHEWYTTHADEKRDLPFEDIQKIQKALDEQIPKKTILWEDDEWQQLNAKRNKHRNELLSNGKS